MFEVEIWVAGEVDPTLAAGAIPGLTTDPEPPVTIIRGLLAPGQDMSVILGILGRHGLTPVDVWVDTVATDS
jgi:hypothetical protein